MNDKKTESYDIFKKDTIEKLERIEEKKDRTATRVFGVMAIFFLALCIWSFRGPTLLWYEIQLIVGLATYVVTLYLFNKFPKLKEALVDYTFLFEMYAICIGVVYALSDGDSNLTSVLSKNQIKFTVIAYMVFYLSLKQQKKEKDNSLNDAHWRFTFSTLVNIQADQMLHESMLKKIQRKADNIPIAKNEKEYFDKQTDRVYPIVATYKVKKR
ncbi:hypothetical protein [Lacticaseibacillus paracasei]|uniref:hypothetical protein n=1 Tax=Lacticaseibacillus paracasei TaxID=1597 RepID=UPI002FFB268A